MELTAACNCVYWPAIKYAPHIWHIWLVKSSARHIHDLCYLAEDHIPFCVATKLHSPYICSLSFYTAPLGVAVSFFFFFFILFTVAGFYQHAKTEGTLIP